MHTCARCVCADGQRRIYAALTVRSRLVNRLNEARVARLIQQKVVILKWGGKDTERGVEYSRRASTVSSREHMTALGAPLTSGRHAAAEELRRVFAPSFRLAVAEPRRASCVSHYSVSPCRNDVSPIVRLSDRLSRHTARFCRSRTGRRMTRCQMEVACM